MKTLFALSVSLFSSALLAMPAVGDLAVYKISANGYEVTQRTELTSFNASTNSFTRKVTTTYAGQSSSQVDSVNASELNTEAQLQMAITYCETPNIGGKLETVSVPAGTFQTCAINTDDGGRANLGVVPFSVVKFAHPEGNLQLIEYKFGR
jgi:hypothetical protein